VTPSLSIAGTTSGSKPVESPKKKIVPLSPQSHGLGIAGRVPSGGDSARPQALNSPQSLPRVVESLTKDLDFIKVGFHIGRFMTVVVNTKAERADIQALRSDLDSASL
jgi:hypothetical protein